LKLIIPKVFLDLLEREAFLRVSKSKEIYTLSISRGVNRKEYMKIGEYSEEDLIKHISNLFKIGMLNVLEG